MQLQQMADTFFGFDPSLGGEDGLDGPLEDEDFGEEDYNALNDETFGSEAATGDWEQDHEKLAQLAELRRPQVRNDNDKLSFPSPLDSDIDVEGSLSHLVLDDKEGVVPKPGVWDSPINLPISKPPEPVPILSSTLKNACTVEELERGLIANRSNSVKPVPFYKHLPPPGDKIGLNGMVPPGFLPPPNFRLPYPQLHMTLMNTRPIPNQLGNLYKFPPPHLLMPHNQRPLVPNSNPFFIPHPSLGLNVSPMLHRRPDFPLISPFTTNRQIPPHMSSGVNHHNQNKFHHDRQNDHQPFFKDNQYHQNHKYNNHQFQHGHHSQHHNYQANNGVNSSGEYDEYAGLMSNREKQWLNNIQLLQLNTNQPYIDDYYFTVFCARINKKGENQNRKDRRDGGNNNNNGFHKDPRNRKCIEELLKSIISDMRELGIDEDYFMERDGPQHTFTKVVYTPTQFENSLGKLQCGSVTAPRKIIDMDVVPNSDPNQGLPAQQKDTKKTRQLLLEIERLYMLQLNIEDINNPLAQLAEQQADDEEAKVKKTLPELITSMLNALLQLVREDKFASMLSIRKGKTLFLRFLPFLSVTKYKSQLEELWTAVIRGLAIIGRRDSHLLANFYTEFRRWLETVSKFSMLLSLERGFMDSANQSSKSNSLTFAVTNKFGVSVLASMLEQAEEFLADDVPPGMEWSQFVVGLAESMGNSTPVASPYEPIAANTLNEHLHRITMLKIDKYAPLELFLTDRNPAR